MSQILPSVSVVIPAKPDSIHLAQALMSVDGQDYPNIVDVVVATSDPVRLAIPDWVKVVTNPTGTTPTGLNLAIAASTGEVIVRCDAHSILPPKYVSLAVRIMQNTGADVVGGMQIPVGTTSWERVIAAAMTSPLGAGDARYRIGGEAGAVETVYLGVFRRSAVQAVGGYDEAFVRNQDYELNHRIIESGGTVWFDPQLKVEYRPRGSIRDLLIQYFDYGRGKRRFSRKHRGQLRLRQIAPVVLTITVAASVLVAFASPLSLLVPATYVAGLILASRGDIRRATALAVMHLGWGVGFLSG